MFESTSFKTAKAAYDKAVKAVEHATAVLNDVLSNIEDAVKQAKAKKAAEAKKDKEAPAEEAADKKKSTKEETKDTAKEEKKDTAKEEKKDTAKEEEKDTAKEEKKPKEAKKDTAKEEKKDDKPKKEAKKDAKGKGEKFLMEDVEFPKLEVHYLAFAGFMVSSAVLAVGGFVVVRARRLYNPVSTRDVSATNAIAEEEPFVDESVCVE